MLKHTPHILVIDDDSRLRELLQRYLTENKFTVSVAAKTSDARKLLKGLIFDLIVLDLMMPEEDGISFTGWLRQISTIPILMLTARGDADDRIAGLESGVDDYLSKPFEPRELILRINLILRRALDGNITEPVIEIQLGSCIYKIERGELWQDSELVHLTEKESELLKSLALNAGMPVSREALILDSKYGGNVRTVDVQVNRLRQKIETNPRHPRYLQTARGKGYVLRPD